MKLTIKEELFRNRILMGLNEETEPIKLSVSKDGIVNFFDLQNRKVYRYKLIAEAGPKKVDIQLKSIDTTTGVIEYVDPQTEEIKTEVMTDDAKNSITNNYKNKKDINNLSSFKKGLITVTISLKFVSEEPLNIR